MNEISLFSDVVSVNVVGDDDGINIIIDMAVVEVIVLLLA